MIPKLYPITNPPDLVNGRIFQLLYYWW